MKREMNEDSFEEFLKHAADNLRMKAPDKVWQQLSGKLNRGRRRLRTALSAFLLVTAVFAYLTISNTSTHPLLTSQPVSVAPQTALPATTQQQRQTIAAVAVHSTTRRRRSSLSATNQMPLRGKTAQERVATAEPDGAATLPFTPTIADDDPDFLSSVITGRAPAAKPAFLTTYSTAPYTIESVINAYTRKARRFQTEFHFTPTISYRKLSENKSYLRNLPAQSAPAGYPDFTGSVSNMVTHKPDFGFEIGVTEKYALTPKLRLRGGLQFNVNRYDIKAFSAPFAIATITLNNRSGSRVDSVRTYSSYSNVNGSSNHSNWLQNLSFQISAPVGVELVLKGNDKMQFGLATTVQPTYVLGDRAYLITTDYKSYTQVPWLLRRWNVNTALETFVSYQTGKTKWQVGPQVRYQLLSSFISNYPVKENLFDFGLKIGVSVNH